MVCLKALTYTLKSNLLLRSRFCGVELGLKPTLKSYAHAKMVDIVSSTADLRAGKDDKVEAQFGFSRE